MKLKSFGCSLIFGSELADDGYGTARPTASRLTWPSLMAQHLGYTYECHARPGAGNLQILEQILSQLHDPEPAVFVVAWSYLDRLDLHDDQWNPRQSLSPWRSLMPIDNSTLAKTYYKELHSSYRDKLTSLCYVKTALDCLQQHRIQHVMTYMDATLFDDRYWDHPAIAYLQDQTRPHMTTFDQMTFVEWSRRKRFAEGLHGHPLEQAHVAAKDYMITAFDKQKTSDPILRVPS